MTFKRSFYYLSEFFKVIIPACIIQLIFHYYTAGDVFRYNMAFDCMKSQNFLISFVCTKTNLGAYELILPIVFYSFASVSINFLGMNFILNCIVLFFALAWFQRFQKSYIIFLLLVFNYYSLVIFIPAIKLKIAFIFLFIYFYSDKKYFFLMSILSHFQILIFLFASIVSKIKLRKLFFFKPKNLLYLCGLGVIIIYFWQGLVKKFLYYNQIGQLFELLPLFGLVGLSILINRKILPITIYIILILILGLIIPPSRINQIAILAFLHFCVKEKRVLHPLNIPLHIYCGFKTFSFISSIIITGSAF
jgi:hypothetical protein